MSDTTATTDQVDRTSPKGVSVSNSPVLAKTKSGVHSSPQAKTPVADIPSSPPTLGGSRQGSATASPVKPKTLSKLVPKSAPGSTADMPPPAVPTMKPLVVPVAAPATPPVPVPGTVQTGTAGSATAHARRMSVTAAVGSPPAARKVTPPTTKPTIDKAIEPLDAIAKEPKKGKEMAVTPRSPTK